MNVARCHVLALGLKMAFVFLGANRGVNTPNGKKVLPAGKQGKQDKNKG